MSRPSVRQQLYVKLLTLNYPFNLSPTFCSVRAVAALFQHTSFAVKLLK